MIKYSEDKRRRLLNDLFLLAAFILTALFIWFINLNAVQGEYIRVTVTDGDSGSYYDYPLGIDGYVIILQGDEPFVSFIDDDTFVDGTLQTTFDKSGYNALRISGGYADMISADCDEQICVHSNPVSKTGESIVCLPHGVTVTVYGSKKDTDDKSYDSVTW